MQFYQARNESRVVIGERTDVSFIVLQVVAVCDSEESEKKEQTTTPRRK